MKKSLLVMMFALFALVLAACGTTEEKEGSSKSGEGSKEKPAEEIVVKHKLDETTVTKNPEKVVVFDFGSLDTLDKFGVEVIGVPKKNLPPYLEKFDTDEVENVGGLKEPDFEMIKELEPDLIIISGRQAEQYESFKEIAPTIFSGIDEENYMESFKSNVTTLSEIFGKEDLAKEELAKIEKDIAALKEKTDNGKKGLITLTSGKEISAYGPGSRFGIIHDVFGVEPADPNIKKVNHGNTVSSEYILEKNPDYIFVVDRDLATEGTSTSKEVIENALVKKTNAYKEGKMIYLDPNYWYLSGGGLVSVAEMVKEISEGIDQ